MSSLASATVAEAAALGGFEDGSLDVAQLLLPRPADDGPAAIPLRPWWHA